MSMIVDFRLRPPIPGFVGLEVPYGRAGQWLPSRLGVEFPASAVHRSLDQLVGEMAEAGITTGVIPGRTVPIRPRARLQSYTPLPAT